MLAAIGLVTALAWKALEPLNAKSGFNRTLITNKLHQHKVVETPQDVVEFAGNTNNHIYFKTTNPSKIYVTDVQLQNGHYETVNVPMNSKITSHFDCIVDSPSVYILAGRLPGIIKTQPGDTFSLYSFPNSLFTRAVLISNNSFVLRSFDKLNQIFVKRNLISGEMVKENNVSEKINDAGISTDGKLLYDKETNSLLYLHYYRNEILCLDTNLNLIRKIKTIDINSLALSKAEQVKSKNLITTLTPKRLLNVSGSTYKGYFFNSSRVKGDDETTSTLAQNSVIDVYDIKAGLYKGSFYIPAYKNKRANNFIIVNNNLIGLYYGYLMAYDLPQLNN